MFPTAVTGVPEGDNAATLSFYSHSHRHAHPTEALGSFLPAAHQHLPQIDSHRLVRGKPFAGSPTPGCKIQDIWEAACVSEIGYNASPCSAKANQAPEQRKYASNTTAAKKGRASHPYS